jgi:hypothetical protein
VSGGCTEAPENLPTAPKDTRAPKTTHLYAGSASRPACAARGTLAEISMLPTPATRASRALRHAAGRIARFVRCKDEDAASGADRSRLRAAVSPCTGWRRMASVCCRSVRCVVCARHTGGGMMVSLHGWFTAVARLLMRRARGGCPNHAACVLRTQYTRQVDQMVGTSSIAGVAPPQHVLPRMSPHKHRPHPPPIARPPPCDARCAHGRWFPRMHHHPVCVQPHT